MRLIAILVAALLIAIQYPLWFGKGGWLRVWDLERQLATERERNSARSARNAEVAAEVGSLRDGEEAIEERARQQLNMVRDGEVYFQLVAPRNEAAAPRADPR